MLRDDDIMRRTRRENDSGNRFIQAMQNGFGALVARTLIIVMSVAVSVGLYAGKLQLEMIASGIRSVDTKVDDLRERMTKSEDSIDAIRTDVTRLQEKDRLHDFQLDQKKGQ